jgi:hypothetical protein
MGLGWAWLVGLGRVLNENTTRSALNSIWKYNFTRNLDAYDAQADPKGRPYYADGEGGVVMTANALGRKTPFGIYSGFACYLNETMNGFESQVAAHMIAEGMVKEGMTVMKTLDERYDGNKRNPFNEVECGDHYGRSMASYGDFIAITGFTYHGPKQHIGFAPKLRPENFKAAFTAAEGWGSYSQKISGGELKAELTVKYGQVPIQTMSLVPPSGKGARKVSAMVDGKSLTASVKEKDSSAEVVFPSNLILKAEQKLEITLSTGG